MKNFLIPMVGMLLLCSVQMAVADQNASDVSIPNNSAEVSARIRVQLELRYPGSALVLAKTNADGTDIVAAGTVLVLQKDNLVMNKVLGATTNPSAPMENAYENGVITQIGLLGSLTKISSFFQVLGAAIGAPPPPSSNRTFVHGEKFWVTKVSIPSQYDGIVFHLMSDPIDDVRYHGTLKFPFAKGDLLGVDQAVIQIADVITSDVPADTNSGASAQGTSMPDIPPPPKPTDSSPKTIALGQTKNDVVQIFGQPSKIARLGAKEIYYYPDMKVTFVKNKVTNIQ